MLARVLPVISETVIQVSAPEWSEECLGHRKKERHRVPWSRLHPLRRFSLRHGAYKFVSRWSALKIHPKAPQESNGTVICAGVLCILTLTQTLISCRKIFAASQADCKGKVHQEGELAKVSVNWKHSIRQSKSVQSATPANVPTKSWGEIWWKISGSSLVLL